MPDDVMMTLIIPKDERLKKVSSTPLIDTATPDQ